MNTFKLNAVLVFGFIISITIIFFIGYSWGKTKTQSQVVVAEKIAPVIDTTPNKFEIVFGKVEQVVKKLEAAVKQLETVSENTQKVLATLEKKANQPTIIHSTHTPKSTETTHSQATEDIPDTQNSILAERGEQTNAETYQKIRRMLDIVDYEKVEKMTQGALQGNTNDIERAIKTLAKIGTPEINSEIDKIILNEDEDTGIRLTAIESIDWKGNVDMLTRLLQTDHSHEIRLATVYAARETEFDDIGKEQLNQVFFDNFQTETNDFVKLAILDYFSDEQPEKIEQLLTLVPPDNFSAEVRKQVELLQNPLPIEGEEKD